MKKLSSKNNNATEDEYTLVEHLAELRTRLLYSLVAVVVLSICSYAASEYIFEIIRAPIQPHLPQGGLVFTAPTDKFMAYLKVSFFSGIIFACPVWIFQVWRFIEPGLYTKEKRYGYYFMFFGTALFLTGISFAYFLVLPTATKFLLSFGSNVDTPMITINYYLSFFMKLTLVFGLAFQMPLVLGILGLLGIVNSSLLRRFRRPAIVIISVVAAFFTPPDIMSMILLMGPLWFLYELSVWIVAFIEPKEEVGHGGD